MAFRLGYRPELNGLRGVAVLTVMLGHLSLLGAKANLSAQANSLVPPHGLMPGGVFGVDIFFVLSGFLITSTLLEERARTGRFNLLNFYIRRILRLAPALYILLTACLTYIVLTGYCDRGFGLIPILLSMLYVSNMAGLWHIPMGMLTHTWSLSVEEQFYFLWPLTLLVLIRLPRPKILMFVAFVAVLSAVLRYWVYHVGHVWVAWGFLPTRADGLLCGIAVALMAHWGWLGHPRVTKYWPWLKRISCVILLSLLFFVDGGSDTVFKGYYFVASVVSAIFIASLVSAPADEINFSLSSRPLEYTGRISYGLYLYHLPLLCLFPLLPLHNVVGRYTFLVGAITFFILSYLIATLSFFTVERKALAFKRRFAGAQHKAALVIS